MSSAASNGTLKWFFLSSLWMCRDIMKSSVLAWTVGVFFLWYSSFLPFWFQTFRFDSNKYNYRVYSVKDKIVSHTLSYVSSTTRFFAWDICQMCGTWYNLQLYKAGKVSSTHRNFVFHGPNGIRYRRHTSVCYMLSTLLASPSEPALPFVSNKDLLHGFGNGSSKDAIW